MSASKRRLALAAAIGLLLPQGGPAAAQDRVRYATAWFAEAVPVWTEARTVPAHGSIVEARLLPRRLVTAADDIRDGQGNLLASRGDQMIALESSLGIYCVADPPTRMSGFSNRRFPCFVDRDGDRRVDGAFSARSRHYNMFLLLGTLPRRLADIFPTAVDDVSPADLRGGPSVSLDFEGVMSLTGKLRFFTRVGRDRDRTVFGRNYDIGAGRLPTRLDVLGAEFNLLEVQDGQLRVEMVRPFDGRPILFL